MNKNKHLLLIVALVFVLACLIAGYLLSHNVTHDEPIQTQELQVTLPPETSSPTAPPTSVPTTTVAPETSVPQPPAITPPASRSEDITSGTDIQLRPVAPSTDSNLQP